MDFIVMIFPISKKYREISVINLNFFANLKSKLDEVCNMETLLLVCFSVRGQLISERLFGVFIFYSKKRTKTNQPEVSIK